MDIRFINSRYKDLFRIEDGGKILVTNAYGETTEMVCRYIDSHHTSIGGSVYHICEWAEHAERLGLTYKPAPAAPETIPEHETTNADWAIFGRVASLFFNERDWANVGKNAAKFLPTSVLEDILLERYDGAENGFTRNSMTRDELIDTIIDFATEDSGDDLP